MKKVLIISYHFSDKTAIGSIRINGLAKYLPLFGWEPVILTAKSAISSISEFRVIEIPNDELHVRWKKRFGLKSNESINEQFNLRDCKRKNTISDRLINIWGEIFAYPDIYLLWRLPAVKIADSLLGKEHFDAMISSSLPATCCLAAKDLKNKYDIPWIADFRDLWTQNHYYSYSRIRKFFERRLEVDTVASADALTTVSQPLATKLKRLHKNIRVYSILNGFDPLQKNTGIPLAEKFTITYTGALYKGRRDPEPLFEALEDLISEGLIDRKKISVEFYGRKEDWLEKDVVKHNLKDVVKILGHISRIQSIEKQRQSHLLLLLTWNDPQEKGVYTGKVFDYLAAQRPILSIGCQGGVVEDLLGETNAGVHCSDVLMIKKALINAYLEFKTKNTLSYNGIPSAIDMYSHIEMAHKFSNILNDLAAKGRMCRH